MSNQHQNDISPIRTFADDIKRVKGDSGSVNTDTVAQPEENEVAHPEVESAPVEPTQPPVPPVENVPAPTEVPSVSGKGIDRSAFAYLSKNQQQTEATAQKVVPDTPPQPTMNYRSIPTIPDTDVALAVDNITKNNQTEILYDEGMVNVDDDLHAGTIIQDKKRKHWKLVPAMGHAVTDWYKDKEEEFVESRQPTHTITKSEARLDTIKAAAATSKLAPSADYQTVSEKLRAQEYEVDHTGIQLKDAEEVPPPSWTHTVEEGGVNEEIAYEAEPTPKPEASVHEPVPVSTANPTIEEATLNNEISGTPESEPIVVKDETPEPSSEQIPEVAPEAVAPIAAPAPTNVVAPTVAEVAEIQPPITEAAPVPDGTATPDTAPMPPQETTAPSATVATPIETVNQTPNPTIGETKPTIETPLAEPVSQTPAPATRQTPQNKLQATAAAMQKKPANIPASPRSTLPNPVEIPLYVYVIGFLVICLLGIGVSFYLFSSANNQPVNQEMKLEPLVQAKKVKVSINPTQESIIDSMVVSNERTGLNTFEFITSGKTVLTPEQIMSNLVPYKLNSLARNTENLAIGFTETKNPYLMIKGGNYETLFGGLLAWEETMNYDLAPLFGPVIEQTSPAFGGNYASASSFRDEVLLNRNARVLYDRTGQEILIYAFINNTTVIIATDRGDIINMISLLQ